jgi:iron complex outermembrane receptor protein
MYQSFCFKKKLLAQLVIGSLLASGVNAAFAQNAVDLGTVGAYGVGETVTPRKVAKESASYQAPTQGSLEASQPQSIINQHYIQENAGPGANYTDIVNIAPSVFSIDPNGPGMMETQSLTLRGFQDGQYNVTFDGIPWGDSNDFTHHSTSYFMNQDIGSILVDRGPGDAGTIGDATSGGTISVNSKDPLLTPTTTLSATAGSFNSHLLGAEFDTGVMQNYGDMSAFIDYKSFNSDGFLTNSSQRRENLFIKIVKPVSDNTVLTFVTMQNNLHQHVPLGATLANIAKNGYNYGLSNDPTRQDYSGYNYDDITADFEYLGVKTQLGDWKVDNKVYTYAYYHNGFNGGNNNGIGEPSTNGTNPALTGGVANTDVPGEMMTMNYRSWGDQLRMSEPLGQGTLDTGLWVDYQYNNRWQKEVDWTLGGAINTGSCSACGGATDPASGYDRLMNDTLTTIQPYVQYEWKATDALTVTPGLKYSSFKRTIDAAVNQGAGGPLNAVQTWSKALPALTAHYTIQPGWTAYAQYATGFLAPKINAFYPKSTSAPTSPGSFLPSDSKNYQIGTTWVDSRLNVSGDVYKVDFNNMAAGATGCGIYTCFKTINVNFSGFEVEGTYVLGAGYSLYGNYALNNYSTTDGSALPNVPRNTAALGAIYNQGPIYASLIAKEVGPRDSTFQDASGNEILFSSMTITNFSSSYSLKDIGTWGKSAKVGFQVNNLFNKNGPYADTYGSDASGNALYYVIPTRNYELSLSVSL